MDSEAKNLVFGFRFFSLVSIVEVMAASSANAFCVRNDTGSPIFVEALDGTEVFQTELANNKKACCEPKDQACGIGKGKVRLSISSEEEQAHCTVEVNPKGNVNVTGQKDQLKCKANKANSTMDWSYG